jgi:PAS domain-containing protein
MQRRQFITFLGAAAAVWKRAKRPATLLREAGYLLLGLVSFAIVTSLYLWLDVPLVAAAFTYLVVLVLLSLVSSLSSLIVLSFIGVGCLSYFFAPPIYSFRVDYAQDLITISGFVITSFVVNFLVTRVRAANQRLEVANKALRIENVERKGAEQAPRESEDKFRQIMDTVLGRPSTGSEGKKAEIQPGFMAQVQAILNVLPTYTWYAAPRGALTFVNARTADYLGIPNDHPLRFGIDIGATWDEWIPLLHPDDQERARKYWSNCLSTGETGEYSYRVRGAQGDYRWFLTRFEPLRASDGTLLLWVGAITGRQDVGTCSQNVWKLMSQEAKSLPHRYATLKKKTADLVDPQRVEGRCTASATSKASRDPLGSNRRRSVRRRGDTAGGSRDSKTRSLSPISSRIARWCFASRSIAHTR